MKTKKRTEIIFERHEITRIRVARRPLETNLETTEIAVDSRSSKKPVGFKARWQERLRGLWKPNQ